MSRCELRLATGLADLFLPALQNTFRQAGYAKVLEYSNPHGPDVLEYRQQQRVVTIELIDEGAEHRLVRLDSESVDCASHLRQAVIACAAEVITALFGPLSKLQPSEVRAKADACLVELGGQLI